MHFMDRVAPELREGLAKLPPLHLPGDLAAFRQLPPVPADPSDSVRITERRISGVDRNPITIKIYEPDHREESNRPALLWIHGGGYVLGHPGNEDAICQSFVEAAGCVVFSPDYRLAPEHPFPAGIEDCYAALLWVASAAAEEWNLDLSRIAIGGGSAGGGLTAALALLARDRGGPAIRFQMPLYPMIDERCATPSSQEFMDPRVWNASNNRAAWNMYLGAHAHDAISPYAAPARAASLAGLPPVYTCVGQLDPFRDETIEYAARLAQAGVEVEFHLYPGCYHAFEHIVPDAEISKRARNGYINALVEAFKR
ncbi:alpha/beta hydrolase [Cohnella caldifontis]|uniref:alpha/beta hydrolase n=1 Tax=Cohnella caldifontis TaxID=3027471 RepID=UPI0023EB26DA|nr:alpha/beta hydrolase [Cohnella sp. YIM B05605]